VWGYAMAHGDRSVDVFVRKLRQKLRAGSPDWSYIHTHFGVGYRFAPEREGGADSRVHVELVDDSPVDVLDPAFAG
jgi:DNA-binding winged helix-turn-helix (wHTH) protein